MAALIALLALIPPLCAAQSAVPPPYNPPERILDTRAILEGHTARPLRYHPEGRDFVITNGGEFFNRPLYCLNSAFRVDGGDAPEFSIYLPGRGGNLRFGIKSAGGVKWLHEAKEIVTVYTPGGLTYGIRDPLLGEGELRLGVFPLSEARGLVARLELAGTATPVELVFAFGGANGMKGRRNGDIGCEREPVSQFFQLHPDQCRGNTFSLQTNTFILRSKPATMVGVASGGTKFGIADATKWTAPGELLESVGKNHELPVVLGQAALAAREHFYLVLRQTDSEQKAEDIVASSVRHAEDLPNVFRTAAERRRAIADRVVVETPDPFINAAVAALCVASDGIWDEASGAYMHGAVAWRNKLLGWRGPYTGDALGWHDRARRHLTYWAGQQITAPIPDSIPPADPASNLSRNEPALHSNGAMSKSHYDMNLVYIDALFRHLLWTGDLEFARQVWPVIKRHLAWERRLFRREFGPDKLPLYEAYAAIWASDDMAYHGGGATHTTAYNYWHNKMAARLAKLLGEDATPYEREAELIWKAMHQYLWLPDRGWFAEWKDYLGLQLVHPNPGLWTIYHTIDSEAATPFEAWQMTRFVDTQIAHIPIHGPGVPDENLFTLPTTSWMPYTWSLNNVVMAEALHTSQAYWQAGRPDAAFPLFKGALLDSMYLGLCPGNVGMTTYFDMARREAQRDFADAVGITSRALVEGLFGVRPDALASELRIVPGFPPDWKFAKIRHPDFQLEFRREGFTETFSVDQKFEKPMRLQLRVPALCVGIDSIMINGRPARWRTLEDSTGGPKIEILAAAEVKHNVVIVWSGKVFPQEKTLEDEVLMQGATLERSSSVADFIEVADQQGALDKLVVDQTGFRGVSSGTPGRHTVFAKMRLREMTWWQPVAFEVGQTNKSPEQSVTHWKARMPDMTRWDTVNLSALFNDNVTQIFRNEYLAPRSPFCSLAIPKQGIGSWCNFQEKFEVDDSGLRATAAKNGGKLVLPNGVPFLTPTNADAKNIIFTSQWDNYLREVVAPLAGRARHAYLLMAGSSNPMQSRFDNGEVIVTYADSSTERLALNNPTTWWPIDQDYFIDDYAFRRPEPIPPRVDLKTGTVRLLNVATFKGQGGKVPGGAATVLDLPLRPEKELKSLTVRALANEVVIGLMAVTLVRE